LLLRRQLAIYIRRQERAPHMSRGEKLMLVVPATTLNGLEVNSAMKSFLAKLNSLPKPPDPALSIRERNRIIRARHAAGVSQADLARQFGISYQRIHQIIHKRRK
jgi:hypothetical protein